MKKFSPMLSKFAGQPVHVEDGEGFAHPRFESQPWHTDYSPVMRQARFLCDENGVATNVLNPDYVLGAKK